VESLHTGLQLFAQNDVLTQIYLSNFSVVELSYRWKARTHLCIHILQCEITHEFTTFHAKQDSLYPL